MPLVAQVAALLAAAIHVWFFVVESVLFGRPGVAARFGLRTEEQIAAVRPMAFNQGFYNLFLAAGPVAGLIAYHAGRVDVGRALVIYGCAFMAACGVVLFVSDRRLWKGMIGQSAPPLIALIAALI